MHERNAWTLDRTGSRRGVTGAATTAGTALPSRGLGGDRCGQRVCRRDGITFRVRILVLRLGPASTKHCQVTSRRARCTARYRLGMI